MNRQNRLKINLLLKEWPHGTVGVSSWLRKVRISRQLVDQYCKSGWLEPIGRGAYKKAGDRVTWEGALHAVQSQLDKKIHVGGKTALTLKGYGHYVEMGRLKAWLFGESRERLPTWFQNYDWSVDIEFLTTHLFDEQLALEQKEEKYFSFQISSPERAIMEMLHLVPQHHTYEESKLIMEAMATLRPDLISQLLKKCQSIKVKRLFMVLAEQLSWPWVERLDLKGVNFGNGKRVVIQGGHLNTKYNITVPSDTEIT